VSRVVFECTEASGEPQFDGIAYRSRLGDELENWAIFEPPTGEARLHDSQSEPVDPHDGDLAAALELLEIELVQPEHGRAAAGAYPSSPDLDRTSPDETAAFPRAGPARGLGARDGRGRATGTRSDT
jgi:hypothetical protein